MRLRKRPWVKEEILEYENLIVTQPETFKGKWNIAFSNSNQIHAEFGTGRGRFITTLATKNPEINYIALEQKQEVLVQGMRIANELNLTNIKFILGNANYLEKFFDHDELTRIYLNFIDPWPKKKHEKRRLTHRNFLNIYKHLLVEKGQVHLKTDNELLFEFSLNEFLNNEFEVRKVNLHLYRNPENVTEHVQTEYELKFMELGKPIYRLEAAINEKLKLSD